MSLGLPTTTTTLQEVGILPTLDLVPIFGLKCWNMSRVYFSRKMSKTQHSSPRQKGSPR